MTKDEAIVAGKNRFFSEKPCRNGHVGERIISTNKCVECHRANKHRYDLAHPDRKRSRMRQWQASNREKVRAINRQWASENPDKCYLRSVRHRARKMSAKGSHTGADIKNLFRIQRGKCALVWCKKSIKLKYHVDHIIALAIGGCNDPGNLQLLCPSCNQSKGAKHPIVFARENGMLL